MKIMGFPAIITEPIEIGNEPIVFRDLSAYCINLDTQREMVYDWESNIPYGSFIGKEESAKLLDMICSDYYLDMPSIVFGTDGTYPMYDYDNHAIHIQKHLFYTSVVIHEAAHAIHKTYGYVLDQTHGPEFVTLYIELLERYMFLYDNNFPVIDSTNKNRLIILDRSNYRAYITKKAKEFRVSIADEWHSLGSMAYYIDAIV